MTPVLERLKRGFVRLYAEARGANGRLADEIRIEGATALRAVAEDSPAGDIQASVQRNAWSVQIGRLEGIQNRSLDQELALRQYRRNIAELDAAEAIRHPTPQNMGAQRMGLFGNVGQKRGIMGAAAVMNPAMLWIGGALLAASASGWGMAYINDLRADRAEAEKLRVDGELEDANRDMAILANQLTAARAARDTARQLAESNRETVAAERQARRRAENEARRIRNAEAQARSGSDAFDYGFGGVPDAEPVPREGSDGGAAGPSNPR